MLNSFLGIETITRGLFIQELNQNITASNLAKKYQDPNGYLISSRQRVNVMEAPSLFFGSMGGRIAVGTGPLVQQITRLRNSFLDTRIQQESSVLGRAEILTNMLNQVDGIINTTGATIDKALTDLATAWTDLATNALGPLDIGLRSAVVNGGVAFATLAHNQFTQLENLQKNLNSQVSGTVDDINQILKQLSLYNTELMRSPGVNVNDLLDARDYALARLSRLVNTQVNFRTNGVVDVYLGSSNLSLVDGAGAAILQVSVMNPHNTGLSNVTIQSSEGTFTLPDASRFITGGNLAGELYARDVVVEGYKSQLDQVVTAVMNVTNAFHSSGYAANGTTTGTNFFTGVSAQDIMVNAGLVTDPTKALLAASSRYGAAAAATNGEIASFIGDIRNVLANNFMASRVAVNIGGFGSPTLIDPTQPLSYNVHTVLNGSGAGTNFTSWATGPAANGTFNVNSTTGSWVSATDSIETILTAINAADPNLKAVFNYTQQQFYVLSNNPINITNAVNNFTNFTNLRNFLTSTIRMNNGFTPLEPRIDYTAALNSTLPGVAPNGPNSQAFRVTPGMSGSFVLNNVTFTYYLDVSSTMIVDRVYNGVNNPFAGAPSLQTLFNAISTNPWAPNPAVNAIFNTFTTNPTITTLNQTATLVSTRPIQILDSTGNFTVFTGFDGNTPIGNLSSGILTQISSDLSAQTIVKNQSSAALDQLNTAQADLAAVSYSASDPGVPFETEQENAVKALIAFNASLQVMQVLNQMYADLVSIVGGAPSNNFLNGRR